MAAPAPAWNLVRAYGTWHNLDGTKKAGSYRVTVPQRVTSITDNVMIPAGVFATGSFNMTPGAPSLDVMIPAVDDPDISPQGATIVLEVAFNDGSTAERFNLQPSINGPEVNLRAVVVPSSVADVPALLFRGVPGGVAELDADGDVINAAGIKVTGGSTGTGAVSSAQITDSTATGRALIAATSPAAARNTIGAELASAPSVVAATGAARTLSATANYHDLTLTSATAAITLPTVTTPTELTLVLRQDATGGRAVTFTPTPTWLAGTAPTLETSASGVTVLSLFTVTGAVWFGSKLGTSGAAAASLTSVIPQVIPYIVRSS